MVSCCYFYFLTPTNIVKKSAYVISMSGRLPARSLTRVRSRLTCSCYIIHVNQLISAFVLFLINLQKYTKVFQYNSIKKKRFFGKF